MSCFVHKFELDYYSLRFANKITKASLETYYVLQKWACIACKKYTIYLQIKYHHQKSAMKIIESFTEAQLEILL